MAVEVTYNLSILTTSELSKPKNKREAKSRYFTLMSTAHWDEFTTYWEMEIRKALTKHNVVIHNETYEATFSIPRHVSDALPLESEQDFKHLLKNTLKIKNDLSAKIFVHEKVCISFCSPI